MFSMAFGFGYMASNLTLAYLVKKPLAKFSLMCVSPVLLVSNALIGIVPGSTCLFVCFLVTFGIYCNYVLSVCDDICKALNINVFSLTPKKE